MKEQLFLERVPPGDNWKCVDDDAKFDNLTSALGYAYKKTKIKEFHVSAGAGRVWLITDEDEVKPEIDELYGD